MTGLQTADEDEHHFYDTQKDGSLFSSDDKSKIQKHQLVYQVKDHGLAVCLFSSGIDLRKDPPYVSVDVGTKAHPNIITTYNFMPSDEEGRLATGKCIEAWTKDLDFLATLGDLPDDDPMHIFGAAMATWKNSIAFREHHANDTPFVAYATKQKGKAAHLLVKRGSRKDKAAQKRRLRRIIKNIKKHDPEEEG